MGILADFFVATEADALQYERLTSTGEDLPADRYQRHELGGLTPLAIETLWAILDRREWQPDDHTLDYIGGQSDGGTWLARLPAPLVARLATITDRERLSAAAAWAATEEIAAPPEDIAPVLDVLVDLARAAVGSDRGLFLWGSV